jgi:proliferating cell nuclear antigen
MLEARLQQVILLKSVLEAVEDLVHECNFECTYSGIAIQAMNISHVALVDILLHPDGFDLYRCDSNLILGINLGNLGKFLKCARNEDILTIKANGSVNLLNMVFESKSKLLLVYSYK